VKIEITNNKENNDQNFKINDHKITIKNKIKVLKEKTISLKDNKQNKRLRKLLLQLFKV
jgi:hypothetical protein